MSVTVHSTHCLDAPFRAAYLAAPAVTGCEYGFAGIEGLQGSEIADCISAWLPGDKPASSLAALNAWQRERKRFRFFFAERYYAPTREAHALFTGKHLGTQTSLLVKVQSHPDALLHPERCGDPLAWLSEPVLNRIPYVVWMQGPVADVRVLSSLVSGSQVHVVMLRHTEPARQSILELSVSPELRHGSEPTVYDRIEATGSDGFLKVTGIWREAVHAPRLEVHRAGIELVQRNLRRDFAQIYEHAAARWNKDHRTGSYTLARAYLETCNRIVAPFKAESEEITLAGKGNNGAKRKSA